jgi:hypothetical protein
MPSVSMGGCARLRRFMMSDLINSVNKRDSTPRLTAVSWHGSKNDVVNSNVLSCAMRNVLAQLLAWSELLSNLTPQMF